MDAPVLGGIPLDHISAPSSPIAPFRWVGGKGLWAEYIVSLLPAGQVYVEPYCGAASVFWHLPRPYPVEVLNDLDRRVVTVFRVLQDESLFRRLAHRLVWTPYSFEEYKRALALLDSDDPLDAAWATIVVSRQGFGGQVYDVGPGSWGRGFYRNQPRDWQSVMRMLQWWHARLGNVYLDCRDALEVIRYWDTADTVFYIDPPYVMETREGGRFYEHEADLEHHRALVATLLETQGQVVLSGYDHHVYRPLEEAGWEVIRRRTAAMVAGRTRTSNLRGEGAALANEPRVEVLWLKRRVVQGRLL